MGIFALQMVACCDALYMGVSCEGHGTILHVHADEIDELQVLDMEYEVEWLQPGEDEIEGVREVLARGQIGRKRSPLTRLLLKSWLQEAAACEPLEVPQHSCFASSRSVALGIAAPDKRKHACAVLIGTGCNLRQIQENLKL